MRINNSLLHYLFISVIVFISVFLISFYVLADWTGPTSNPPGNNTPTPLNVSTSAQTKEGSLNILDDVGIGTTTPAYPLDVQGEINTSDGFCINGECKTSWSQVGGGGVQGSGNANYIPIWVDSGTLGTSTIYESSGNVGIGTTGPGKKLDVNGDVRIRGDSGTLHFYRTTNPVDIAKVAYDGVNSRMVFYAANKDMFFSTKYNELTTPILFLGDTNGNVGIGTTTPGYLLDAQGGEINASDGLCINGDCKTSWSQVGGGIQGSGATNTVAKFTGSGTIGNSTIFDDGTNVGIGTTNPGAKLEVNGQVKITGGSPGSGKVLTSDANGLATWETVSGGGGDITAVNAGSGLSGGGTSGDVTLSHADTSNQSSVDNSGNTFIQDVSLDDYGHVTSLSSGTATGVQGSGTADYVAKFNGSRTITTAGIYDDGINVGIGTASPGQQLAVNGITDMMSHRIINVADPTDNTDAANKEYVDDMTWYNLYLYCETLSQRGGGTVLDCPSDFKMTGGGCLDNGEGDALYSSEPSGNGWYCESSGDVTTYVRCCRMQSNQ